jgi:hypothetical protein
VAGPHPRHLRHRPGLRPPPAQTLPELTDLLNPLWRVSDIAHPDDTHASLQIRSQIDRTCSVHITHHPERNE